MSTIAVEGPARAPSKTFAKQRLKRLLYAGFAGCLALGAARYGYDWWSVGRFIESTDDAYAGGNVTPISPHVAGFVAEILVADNEYVRAGQPLIRLDDRDFQAAVDRASAIVAARQATLASLQAKEALQQSAIRQAKADLDGKTAQAAFATRRRPAAIAQLALSSAGSRQNAERAPAADEAAQSGVARVGGRARRRKAAAHGAGCGHRRGPSRRRAGRGRSSDRASSTSATPKSARRSTAMSATAPPRSAPMSPAAPISLTVIPAHDLWVDANFKEDQLARMAPGESATVVADVLPDHVFHGHVVSLAPGTGAVFSVIPPENATGNFTKIVQRVPVRIALDGDDPMLRALRPGLSTTVSVDTRSGSERRAVTGAPPPRLASRSLAALRGHVRRHVHRAAGHPDRRFLPAGHRRRPVRGAG